MIVFRLTAFDKFMRRAETGIALPAIAGGLTLVLRLPGGWIEATLWGVLTAIAARGAIATWRHLWRVGRDRYEAIVFDFGVRGVGIAMALLQVYILLGPESRVGDAHAYAVAAAIPLLSLLGLIQGLWAGLWWGRFMAYMLGVQPDNPSSPPSG